MKPRQPNETDAHYIARLEAQNLSLREHNKRLTAWQTRINDAVTLLSTEGSLVFQAMAEKAGVRSHPSVTKVIELLSRISHPQWANGQAMPIDKEWPTDWALDDAEGAWSGDADMELNAPLKKLHDLFSMLRFSSNLNEKQSRVFAEALQDIDAALLARIQGFKAKLGFKPKHLQPAADVSYRDMTREQLIEHVDMLGWMALDLAQDLESTNDLLRRDLRAANYRRVTSDLYKITQFAVTPPENGITVTVMQPQEEPAF